MKIIQLFQTYTRESNAPRGFGIDANFLGGREPELTDMIRLFCRPDGGADVFMTMEVPAGARIITPGGGVMKYAAGRNALRSPPTPLMVPSSDVSLRSDATVTVGVFRDTLIFIGTLLRDGVMAPAEGWYWETKPSKTPHPRSQKCLA